MPHNVGGRRQALTNNRASNGNFGLTHMLRPICCACGTQYPNGPAPPSICPICEDERQFVPEAGQAWTTLDALRRDHRVARTVESPGLHALTIDPGFAIGQQAFLIRTPTGNVLWECLALIDDSTIAWIRDNGGLSAIAISHPHFYTALGEWSDAFGGVPVYLHADDAEWVRHRHPAIRHWSGETHALGSELTLIRCGGHFEGGTVLHWAEGRGTLFSGDILQVVADRRHVSFMRSYPNLIPLDAGAVTRIGHAVAPYSFETIHGSFPGRTVAGDGNEVVARSVDRYLRAIGASRLGNFDST